MRRWIVVAVDLALAVACVVAAGWSWRQGSVTTSFASAGDLPAFEVTRYVGGWLLLAAGFVLLAGLITIDAAARITARAVK